MFDCNILVRLQEELVIDHMSDQKWTTEMGMILGTTFKSNIIIFSAGSEYPLE